MKKCVSVVSLTAISLLLAACGPRGFHYHRPNTSEQQEAKDAYECRQEATYYSSSASVGPYSGSASYGPSVSMEMGAQCLKARGYTIEWVQ